MWKPLTSMRLRCRPSRHAKLRYALPATKRRLSRRVVPGAIVIGSDQTVDADGIRLGKPMSHGAALAQLQALQGRTAVFYTALAVIGPTPASTQVDCIPTRVKFRNLPKEKLEAYLRADQPYDCAGAAKIESLGIVLIESAESSDPTALVGLPLIRLTSMLSAAGIDVLARR